VLRPALSGGTVAGTVTATGRMGRWSRCRGGFALPPTMVVVDVVFRSERLGAACRAEYLGHHRRCIVGLAKLAWKRCGCRATRIRSSCRARVRAYIAAARSG